jgi:integrase
MRAHNSKIGGNGLSHIHTYLNEVGRRLAPQSLAKYTDQLTRFNDWREETGAKEYSKASIRAFLVWLQGQDFADSQVSLHRSAISAFCSWLVENEIIEANPVTSLRSFVYRSPKKGVECMFTEDEYKSLRAAAGACQSELEWYGAIVLAWNTAMRLGDVCCLESASVNVLAKRISIIPKKTERLHKRVDIPILPDLEAFLQTQPLQGRYVLPAMQREYAANESKGLTSKFARICEKAGVEGKTFHGLRHTATSRMLNNGVPPSVVSSVTGHSLKVLDRYTHTPFEQARSIVMEAMR